MTRIMSLLQRLGQKFSLGKRIHENFFKRLVIRLVLLAFVNQNLAFATHQILELDFKDSQASQRLHTILPSYKIADVSHVEIDTEKRQVAVYRKGATQLPEDGKDPSSVLPEAIQRQPVIVPAHDIQNLPWDLEPEKLTLFLLNHTAWLNPLDEHGYKLEFRGGLLGGMMKKKELNVNVTQFNVDCQGRNDWPKGTIGDKFCKNDGYGSGNFGIPVINKPYVPPVDNDWQKKIEKADNMLPLGQPVYRPPIEWKPELKPVNVKPVKAPSLKMDDKKIHQGVGKDVQGFMKTRIGKQLTAAYTAVFNLIPALAMKELAAYRGGDLPQKTLDAIARNVSWKIDAFLKETEDYIMFLRSGMIRHDKDGRYCGTSVDPLSQQAVSRAYMGLKKQYAEELENLKKKQKLEEEQREKQKEIKEKERKERDKKILTPYLESWNKLYPNRAKKNAQELAADPTTGYKSGMSPEEAQKVYETWYKGRYEQTVTSETILPYLKAYYPSLKDVRYDPHISQVEHKDTYQIRPQSFFENDIRQARDKKTLDPYLESWNKLYPERAKKQYYELASDPTTGYKSGMSSEEAKKVYDKWYKGRHEQKASSEGAALFKEAPSQYQVTPVYFAKSASDAGMNPVKALNILTNPTLDNAYERVLLASRQNYLGGRNNPFVFRDMGLSVGEAYDNLLTHLRGEYFGQLLDEKTNQGIKEGFERFCRERQEIFEDYLVEEWGVRDWREVAESLDYDGELIQVGGKADLFKEILKFGAQKGGDLLKQGWQKAIQAYKGDIVKGLKIDKSVENKLTQQLGKPRLADKDIGLRWEAPKGNGVRIMKGRKDADFECQRNDYVQVRRGGQVIGRNQKEVKPTEEFSRPSDNPEAHIPYEEWVNWGKLLGE